MLDDSGCDMLRKIYDTQLSHVSLIFHIHHLLLEKGLSFYDRYTYIMGGTSDAY